MQGTRFSSFRTLWATRCRFSCWGGSRSQQIRCEDINLSEDPPQVTVADVAMASIMLGTLLPQRHERARSGAPADPGGSRRGCGSFAVPSFHPVLRLTLCCSPRKLKEFSADLFSGPSGGPCCGRDS